MKTGKKAFGFYAGLFSCVLAIAAAIYYGVVFPGVEYKEQVFDLRICVILVAAGVLSAALLLAGKRTAGFAPVLLCLGSGVALMLFINVAIWPVSDTIYGIEPFAKFTELMLCAGLILAALIVGEIALYAKKHHPAA